MAVERTVLVVSPTTSIARAVAASVRRNGYHAIVVKSFGEAKKHMALAPDLLITELKLGEFNGLHLAVRASTSQVPAIVIADASFEHEVERLGAVWVSQEAAEGEGVQTAMVCLLQGVGTARTGYWYDGEAETAATPAPEWHAPVSGLLH
jgi:hypothetical protein